MIFIPGVYRLTARRRRLHSGIAESEQREKAGGETLWGGEEKGERPTMQPDSLSVDAIPGRLGPVRGKSIPFASLGSALLIAIPLPTSSSPFFNSPLFQTQIYFFFEYIPPLYSLYHPTRQHLLFTSLPCIPPPMKVGTYLPWVLVGRPHPSAPPFLPSQPRPLPSHIPHIHLIYPPLRPSSPRPDPTPSL